MGGRVAVELKDAIVTIDAMGCQKNTAKKIVNDCKSHYILGLKGNQEILHEDVKLYFDTHTTKDKTITCEKTTAAAK